MEKGKWRKYLENSIERCFPFSVFPSPFSSYSDFNDFTGFINAALMA